MPTLHTKFGNARIDINKLRDKVIARGLDWIELSNCPEAV